MGLIVKSLKIQGNKGEKTCTVLFDTGARRSVIRRDVVEDISSIQGWFQCRMLKTPA